MLRPVFRLRPLAQVCLALIPVLALAAESSALSGHVLSSGNHRPVVGLHVGVLETGARTVTDNDGAFRFAALPAGQYTVVIDADGVERARRAVTVDGSGAVVADIELDQATSRLQTIEVLAQRAPAVVARATQQDAPNMVNLTTAEEIRKLPDVSAAEALQRVPGVALTYDTGEARYTVIRGLSSDFNAVTFGGLRLPPTDTAAPSQGRAVAMDVIPTGLVGALTVTKTTVPEQDAEAIGGTIEITPKTAPLSGKTFLEGHIGGGRETLRNTGITDLSLTAGTRFGGSAAAPADNTLQAYSDKPFSVVGTATYYEDKRGIDDAEEAYQIDGVPAGTAISPKAFNSFEQRWYQYHRIRKAFGLDLGYQPDANNSWYLRAFTSGYTETVERQRLVWNFAGNATFPDANGNFSDQVTGFDKTLRDHEERIGERVIAFGGKHLFDDKVFDYRLGFTRGQDEGLYDRNTTFSYAPANPIPVSYNNSDANYPSFSLPSGVNPFNPAVSSYLLGGLRDQQFSIIDQEKAVSANLKLPTQWTALDGENIKVGVNARMRTRNNPGNFNSSYNPAPLDLVNFQASPPIGFYDGHYNNGPQISAPAVAALYGSTSPYYGGSAYDPSSTQDLSEDVYALYGQYEFGFGNWSFIGGARAEATRAKYSGNLLQVNATSTTVTPITSSHDYNNLFPQIQGRYTFTPDLIGRVALSTNIARPTFNQVNAATVIDNGGLTITTGNPNLKPTTAVNFDLSLEQYLPHGGIMSVGLFDKEFSDYIIQSGSHPVINGSIYTETSYSNDNGSSYARGIELNYEQRYTMLPGAFGGLGTSANYTFVDSRFQIRPGEYSTLPLAARNTANLALFYERDGLNLRLALYYVGRNLFGVGGNASQDNFAEARTLLDFGGSYAIDKQVSVYLNLKNLNNAPLKYSEGSSDRLIQREFYGVTMQAGVNLNY